MNKKLFFITAISIIIASKKVLAANEIVDVRRNITLSDDEIPAKDFYIKTDGGLKKNLVVKATRKINVKDASQKPVGDFVTTVGLVKIIHVEGSIAVAREFKLLPRTDQPMLEQIGIMTGDQIDLSDSFVDTTKPVEVKKKVAAADTKSDTELPVTESKDVREPATAPTDTPAVKPESVQRDI